ncbi:MAG: T9SS type A sorting domain-containing protein [bacterium]
MKKRWKIVLLLMGGVVSLLQGQVVPTTTWTDFYSSNTTLNGSPIQVGAVIEAFDAQGVLCGQFTVTTAGMYGYLHVYGDDPTTTGVDEGASPGDTIRFKINGTPATSTVAAIWVAGNPGAILQIDLTAISEIRHSIVLPQGWNMVSSFVTPKYSHLDSVFSKLKTRMVIAKNGAGQIYWPGFSINTIVNWNIRHGYQIYMLMGDTLHISGSDVDPQQNSFSLPQGWNMISYLRNSPKRADSALATLTGSLVIAKNGAGQIYWPSFNINTMGNMKPGQGYQMYLSSSATLTYPANTSPAPPTILTKRMMAEDASANPQPTIYRTENTKTGSNATLLIVGNGIKDGEEVGVWTQEKKLVGSGVVTNGIALVTIWGDDEMTEGMNEGAGEGEKLTMSVWSGKERELKIGSLTNGLTNLIEGKELRYKKDGVWIARVDEVEETVPERFVLEQNYPNPFNPSSTIQYQLPVSAHVWLKIFNTLGQEVAMIVDEVKEPGRYQVHWSANIPSGLYFYQLKAGSYIETRKMIVLR